MAVSMTAMIRPVEIALNLYEKKRLVTNEGISKRQKKKSEKKRNARYVSGRAKSIVGNGKKCRLSALSSFPSMFIKGIL